MQSIVEQLDVLADLRAQRDNMNAQKQAAIDFVLTPDIKMRLAEVESGYAELEQGVLDNIAIVEANIKTDVLARQETVRGMSLMATWNNGRVSWDDKALQGYMKVHPELAEFRRQGEPSVSIRVNTVATEYARP